jgi:hypothetical protein
MSTILRHVASKLERIKAQSAGHVGSFDARFSSLLFERSHIFHVVPKYKLKFEHAFFTFTDGQTEYCVGKAGYFRDLLSSQR